ncbi:MAG: right-handed parallel beta-helix repeat-containing protein [Spirochaetales bacterium]|nr:right-handed parallel beta-helix repeat-containing protein [Spirochaetales bacterium]
MNESPVLLKKSVTIKPGEKLSIEAGVIVRLGSRVSLRILGTLDARGSEGKGILFTSIDPGLYWGSLEFNGKNNNKSVVSHCIFERGGALGPFSGEVSFNETTSVVTVLNCIFRQYYHKSKGIWALKSPNITIGYSIFKPSPNTAEGIRARFSPLRIEYCVFEEISGYNDSIDLEDCRAPDPVPEIRYCYFKGSEDDCVDLDRCDGIVENCLFEKAGRGSRSESSAIAADQGSKAKVLNNVIINCRHGFGFKNESLIWMEKNIVGDCYAGVWLYINRQFPGFGPGIAGGRENIFWNVKEPLLLENGAEADNKIYTVREIDLKTVSEELMGRIMKKVTIK